MPSTLAGFGLKPVMHASAYGTRGVRSLANGITTGYSTDIFENQAVKIATSGVIQTVTGTEDFVGSFVGVEYTDSQGRRRVSNTWPASTSGTEIVAYFYDDPNMVYEIQANGTVAQTAVGDQANLASLTAGSTNTGLSAQLISSTLAGAGSQGQLRIMDKAPRADNDWGDTYPILRVMIATHQFVSSKVGI